ncbi:kinase-like protein [Trematosphaeria pertusa]|uniref:Kinase-like protein n=1 Tax=Trematosphaeria pertusa TaxID=390896 RepID=A0A6A6ITI6_9PLEO|nr:kinase-like protein [Trematosphaeria pertusa]KAF2253831.1 kinase-like protein [Trematosphaeria pertusa]
MAKNEEEEYLKIAARPLKLLGAGVSGHVFVVDDHTVVKVALKSGNAYMDNEWLQDHLIERRIYERLGKHDRICELKYTIDRGLVLARLKQCLRERLVDFRKRNMLPSYEERFRWSIQAAQGSAYIHEKGVLQSDIGCQNLLLDENDNIKLCDFGGSSIDGSKPLCSPGTGFQRPTEDEDTINIRDELFALGSTIYEIWTSKKPYQDDSGCDADYRTVLDHFKNQRFPDLTGILPASIIMKCWLGYYASAAEVVIDFEALRKTLTTRIKP